MAKIVSFLRCSTFVLIVGIVFSNSLIFSKASLAQTVTPRSTVTLSKNSKLVQSQAGRRKPPRRRWPARRPVKSTHEFPAGKETWLHNNQQK